MDQLVNFIIRPPRADYSPSDDLLEQEFMLKGRWFLRKDLEVINGQGKKLQCSHYIPAVMPEAKALPCVIYCHGNSGCRADASEAAIILLPSNITVFTLDFSGSGLSEGEHVTLGWNEKEDLKAVVNYLRTDGNISCIGLWGRSMGAVTSLMYGAEDPSIAGMVLDSPFSNLVDLMMELVDTYKYPLPKFTVKLAIQHMRKIVKRKASFDIMDLDTIQVAKRCFVPALFGHATEDDFILPHHSDKICESYVGDKNIIKFDGDHNSPRPQFYFDSITIFFHNVLNPPDVPDEDYFMSPHGSLGQGHWDTEHDIEYRIAQSPTASATTTEDAIAQLRSRRLMSRMEVPSVATTEGRADRSEVLDSDVGPSSSSASTATPPNGRNGRMLTPTSDDGEYVEYSFDSVSDMPYTEADEDRMLMQAILESLKDLDKSNTKNTESVASDAASKENNVAKDCNHTTDVAKLETDACSISVRATDVPAKDVAACNSEAEKADVQNADRSAASDAAVSVNAAGTSAPNGSIQAVIGKSGSAESQKPTQNSSGQDGTRATLVVQKSRTGRKGSSAETPRPPNSAGTRSLRFLRRTTAATTTSPSAVASPASLHLRRRLALARARRRPPRDRGRGGRGGVVSSLLSPEDSRDAMPGGGVGVQAPEASPGRYVRRHDEVAPDDDGCDDVLGVQVRGPGDDPFDIPAKRAPVERLRRWRQAALVLNASRRFRYTLDLKKEEEKEQIRRKIRAHAQVIRAALLFKEAGEKQNGDRELPEILPRGFGIGEAQLTSMTRDHNYSALQEYGGVKGLINLLKTNPEKGIQGDEADLSCRANAFGANRYPRKKGRSFWVFLWEACQDLTLVILIVAAAISLALGIATEGIKEGWYDGASIAFAVFLVILVTAVSDYKQSLQFQHLNEEKQNIQVEVIRGGRRVQVSIFDIVVGDVVSLKIGDQVPSDGVLISGHSLAIDESSMTGESKIVFKDQKSPFLMGGCKVADGYGTMLVTAVGLNTEWGLLMASISEDNNEETPLQVRLNGVATFIGIVGLVVAALVLVVLFARYFTGHTTNPDGTVQFVKGHTSVKSIIFGSIKILTVAVTIIVVAVPEGLPLAVTLTLAYSMRKMMADKALVRRLSACETMGSATTICSDKTGTLTLNQMTVVRSIVAGIELQPQATVEKLSPTVTSFLLEGIAQNTSGSVFEPEDGSTVEVTGSPTEKAILSWGLVLHMKFAVERSKSAIIHVSPFNSEKKRGGVAVIARDSDVHVHWKGAAEIVLALCTNWLDVDGSTHEMTPDKANQFKKYIEDMAEQSLRCVAFAYRNLDPKDIPSEEQRINWQLPDNDLTLIGIVGMKDPCRPGVRDAVELCTSSGVKVRMVTGDNLQTARAIALECGILTDPQASSPVIIEGRVFREYSDAEREAVADKISVMGRSSPNDKLLLVKALKKNGHVVAVTGDGTNDAPALHEADIGLSMGIQGTEVAKESSDIIILDDNFASVVKVVRWGRSVYANIQKFIQFQLTVNVAALIINVVAAISSGNVPLNAVQLLWVNLIMDTLGALALATEPPTDQLMKRTPVGRREPLVTNIMWRNLFIQAVYQVAVLLTLNFGGQNLLHLTQDTLEHSSKVKNSFIFNTFVLCQVFNEFNSRKPEELNIFEGISRNHLFLGVVSVTVVLQVIIIEFLGKFTSTVRLSWELWLVSVGIAFVSWPLAFVGKFIPVPQTPLKNLILKCWPKRKKQGDEGPTPPV